MRDRLERAENDERLAQLQMLSAILAWYFGSGDMRREELDGFMARYGAAVSAHRIEQALYARNNNPALH